MFLSWYRVDVFIEETHILRDHVGVVF